MAIGDNSPPAPAHQGFRDAWYPAARCATLVRQQTVRIPVGAAADRLTFWLHLDPGETVPRARDVFEVKVRGADGRLVVLGSASNLQAGKGCQQYSLNLNAYRGQRVQLSFVASSFPGGLGTGFVLDDVSLIAR